MRARTDPLSFDDPHSDLIQKRLLVLQRKDLWASFLQTYFTDFSVWVDHCAQPSHASGIFDQIKPSVVFCEPAFLSPALIQKLKVRKQTDPMFRVYLLDESGGLKKDVLFDGSFNPVPVPTEFGRHFSETLPMPERVRLLVVDDEKEIATMVRDYFAGRTAPAFEIEHARNGTEGFLAIARKRPDVIVLDIKMPVMDGREFYTRLKSERIDIPVIVFFDSISCDELAEMRRIGNPAVVEKGARGSSLGDLMILIKQRVYFGAQAPGCCGKERV